MNETEFLEKIEIADANLAHDDIPIYSRPFQAFYKLAPDYQGKLLGYEINMGAYPPFVGPRLLKRITEWYKERYGKRYNMPSDLGKIPIVLRRQVYLIRIPLVYGQPKVSILPLVEGLSDNMARSLTQNELDNIKQKLEIGFALIYDIDDLMASLGSKSLSISETTYNLLRSAIEDRDTSIRCLTGQLDTNGACFHAQQHSEKMLKTYLIAKGVCALDELSKHPYRHNLMNIFSKCVETSTDFYNLTSDIMLLKNITMDIRYTSPKIKPEGAVETVWAALRVGGLCASQLSSNKRRCRY